MSPVTFKIVGYNQCPFYVRSKTLGKELEKELPEQVVFDVEEVPDAKTYRESLAVHKTNWVCT